MTEKANHIGPNIARLRQAAGKSQGQLAREVCISRPWLSEIEANAGKPSVDLLCDLAAALRVPVATLLKAPK